MEVPQKNTCQFCVRFPPGGPDNLDSRFSDLTHHHHAICMSILCSDTVIGMYLLYSVAVFEAGEWKRMKQVN